MSKSPHFLFKTNGLEYANFEYNGETSGSQIIQPNFTDLNYTTVYRNLVKNLKWNQTERPFITYKDIPAGYGIFKFITVKKCGNYDLPRQRGMTRLSIRFKNKLAESMTLIVKGEFSSYPEIDKDYNVHFTT